MHVIPGLVLSAAGLIWLTWMALRRERPVTPLQALVDFTTGAPLESVLAVGLLGLGLLALAASFV